MDIYTEYAEFLYRFVCDYFDDFTEKMNSVDDLSMAEYVRDFRENDFIEYLAKNGIDFG